MSTETVTGATVANPEVTADPEGPEVTESVSQDSTKKLEEFEAKVREYSAQLEAALKAKSDAEARAAEQEEARKLAERAREFEERKYKGLQRETNKKDESLKRLEAQMASQAATQSQLNKIERFVAKLAETQLDPTVVEQFSREFALDEQKREIEKWQSLAQAAQAQAQQKQQPQELSAEQKQYYYSRWFEKDFPQIDPLDSTIDWHLEATTDQEWVDLMRAELTRRQPGSIKKANPSADYAAQVKAEIEAQLAAQREEAKKELAAMQASLAKAQEELAETKRIAEERLNRAKGMDRSLETSGEPGSTTAVKKLNQELMGLNDEDLYSKDPKIREAYSKKVNDKTLRDRLIAAAQQAQSK